MEQDLVSRLKLNAVKKLNEEELLKKFSRSFYMGSTMSILETLLRSVLRLQYAPVGPKLSEGQIANRLLKMGIVDNEDEARVLTQEVVNREYPTTHSYSAGRKFDKLRTKEGAIVYRLFDQIRVFE